MYDVIFKCDPEELPQRIYPLYPGDAFTIQSSKPVHVGDQYHDYPAVISSIFYYPRSKWWKFWEKKRQWGYVVTWRGEKT